MEMVNTGIKGILFAALLVMISCRYTTHGHGNFDFQPRYHVNQNLGHFNRDISECNQGTNACEECLSVHQCSWCNDGNSGGKCLSKRMCLEQHRRYQCTEPTQPVDVKRVLEMFLDAPTMETNLSCNMQEDCQACTTSPSCSWCVNKGRCLPFSNSSTATALCESRVWFQNQCIYSSIVKPCPQRTGGCKECVADSLCYYCKSTGNCSHYPHDAFVPDNCPSDSWFYKQCSRMKLIVVLAPILCILLLPVLLFIGLGIGICVSKKLGVEGADEDLEEEDETPEPASPLPKKGPPFTMNHKPEPSRVAELKKKYNLGN